MHTRFQLKASAPRQPYQDGWRGPAAAHRTSPAAGEALTAELGDHDAMSNLSTTTRGWRRTVIRSVRSAVTALLVGGVMLVAACSSSGTTASGAQNAKASPAAHVSGSAAAHARVNCKNIDSLRASP